MANKECSEYPSNEYFPTDSNKPVEAINEFLKEPSTVILKIDPQQFADLDKPIRPIWRKDIVVEAINGGKTYTTSLNPLKDNVYPEDARRESMNNRGA